MDYHKKVQLLIEKGCSCLGMINEARSKCLLLQNKMNFFKENTDTFEDHFPFLMDQIIQIRSDLNRYSEQLGIVREELKTHGAFSSLE
jgi:hypothetical protein